MASMLVNRALISALMSDVGASRMTPYTIDSWFNLFSPYHELLPQKSKPLRMLRQSLAINKSPLTTKTDDRLGVTAGRLQGLHKGVKPSLVAHGNA